MKKEKKKVYSKADYRGANPEQVARALLKYRPKVEKEEKSNVPDYSQDAPRHHDKLE